MAADVEVAAEAAAFGAVLRRSRLAAGLTQEELAERAGLSARAISDLERGERTRPQRDTTARLARALGLGPGGRRALEAAVERRRGPAADRAGGRGAVPPHNLPAALTSFVGRERELAAIRQALAASRLVTLTGTGGVGKTRLALQAAADALERFPDGVWLAELASLADPDLVPSAVARAVGVRERPGQPLLDTIVEATRPRRLLLLLDNCEHLLDACAGLAEALLRGCPGVRVLATSRQALGMAGETSWRVPSLAVPEDDQPVTPEVLSRSQAVQLFCARAVAARPGFALTEGNAAAVADLCRRLDGIPLALELAAARARALGVRQLAERLDDRFRLLTGGNRTAMPRQRTLRAAVDWSYDLLDDAERRLFRRLAVFAGGWTLEAAEAVCSGQGIEREAAPDLLSRLVEQSLVQAEEPPDGGARYRLLEMLRQYGRERLEASGEADAVRGRHARHYAALIGECYGPSVWFGPNRRLSRVVSIADTERDNLRAALRWFADRGDPESGLLLSVRLSRYWHLRGPASEGRDWLGRFLAQSRAAAPSSLRAAGLLCASHLAAAGEDAAAEAMLEDGLAMARQVGDAQGMARMLEGLGRRALRRRDDRRARVCYDECLLRARDAMDMGLTGMALIGLGDVARLRGDDATAAARYEECRGLGVHGSWAERGLCYVALHRADVDRARELIDRSLAYCRSVQSTLGVTECLAALAAIDVVRGEAARAVRLLAAETSLLDRIGAEATGADRAEYDRFLASARASLSQEAFAAAWAEGRALTLEQAISSALREGRNG